MREGTAAEPSRRKKRLHVTPTAAKDKGQGAHAQPEHTPEEGETGRSQRNVSLATVTGSATRERGGCVQRHQR